MELFYRPATKTLEPQNASTGAEPWVFASSARAVAETVLHGRLVGVVVCAATVAAATVSSAFVDGALAGPIPSASVKDRRKPLGV